MSTSGSRLSDAVVRAAILDGLPDNVAPLVDGRLPAVNLPVSVPQLDGDGKLNPGTLPAVPDANLPARLADAALSAATDAAIEAAVGPAAERTIYVSPNGNNANHGRTLGKAKLTVKGALDALAGATNCRIVIGVGTITEPVAWGAIPAGTVIEGAGKLVTTICKAFSGDLATLSDGCNLTRFRLDGQGATYTGRLFSLVGTAGHQSLTNVRLYNADGECLWFAYTAGSGFQATDCEMWRLNASAAGSGRYAIVIEDVHQESAVPRKFVGLSSAGAAAIDFGSSNDTFVSASFINDLRFTENSMGVLITGTRLASKMPVMELRGANNCLVGCDQGPVIEIQPGSGGNVISNNYNRNPGVVDLSGLGSNKVMNETYSYVPTFTDSGGTAALGNGTITGQWCRSGALVTTDLTLTTGSTTSFGTGFLLFGIPQARAYLGPEIVGTAHLQTATNAHYTFSVLLLGGGAGDSVLRLVRDGSGWLTGTNPVAIGANSTLRIHVTYRH